MSVTEIVQLGAVAVQTLVFILGGGAIVVRTSAANKALHEDIKEMEKELESLAKVITVQAVQDVRLTEQSRRMTMLEQRVEDLRRGRGYVQDRDQEAQTVNREY